MTDHDDFDFKHECFTIYVPAHRIIDSVKRHVKSIDKTVDDYRENGKLAAYKEVTGIVMEIRLILQAGERGGLIMRSTVAQVHKLIKQECVYCTYIIHFFATGTGIVDMKASMVRRRMITETARGRVSRLDDDDMHWSASATEYV